MSELDLVRQIASDSLRTCYLENGIIAGPHHFTDYWARDSFFAAFGSLAIGDTEIVDSLVSLFFSYQRPDGLIPYRIMRGPVSIKKYSGKPKLFKNPQPTYKLRGFGQIILDGTTLSILFATLLKRKDLIPQIKMALALLNSHEKHGLLWDGPMGEWNDSVWKWGNLLYSNIIYWYVYDRLATWTEDFDPTWSKSLKEKYSLLSHNLRERLWNGKYFADWHDYKRQDYLYPFGNCLAIAWGLTTNKETESILSECFDINCDFTLETNSPKYPWWRVDLFQRLAGMADYQNHGVLWWQPITTYLLALKHAGHQKQANEVANKIAQKILRDEDIYECYERDGSPVRRPLYSSEHPFAWASGLILWALAYNDPHVRI